MRTIFPCIGTHIEVRIAILVIRYLLLLKRPLDASRNNVKITKIPPVLRDIPGIRVESGGEALRVGVTFEVDMVEIIRVTGGLSEALLLAPFACTAAVMGLAPVCQSVLHDVKSISTICKHYGYEVKVSRVG